MQTLAPALPRSSGALSGNRLPVSFGYLLLAGGLAGGAFVWLELGLPTPPCMFHLLTGYPCLTCGATRLVAALWDGAPLTALRMNPMLFVLFISAPVYWVWDGLRQIRSGVSHNFFDFVFNRRVALRWLLGIAALANWAFIIWDGR